VNAIARRATRAADVPKPLARSRTWTASVTTSSRPTCSRPSGRRRRRRHRAAAAWLVAALVRMASRDRCSPSLTDRLPDLRGFGWADAPRRGYSTGELVEDSLALLDALELERVWVIGDELGGRLGFHVSLCRPTAVRGHLALNALHPYWRARHLAPMPAAVVDRVRRDTAARTDGAAAAAWAHQAAVWLGHPMPTTPSEESTLGDDPERRIGVTLRPHRTPGGTGEPLPKRPHESSAAVLQGPVICRGSRSPRSIATATARCARRERDADDGVLRR
jgi:pimeloyl-ACP methyl ester carboxylesterase